MSLAPVDTFWPHTVCHVLFCGHHAYHRGKSNWHLLPTEEQVGSSQHPHSRPGVEPSESQNPRSSLRVLFSFPPRLTRGDWLQSSASELLRGSKKLKATNCHTEGIQEQQGKMTRSSTTLGIHNPHVASEASSWDLRRCGSSVEGGTSRGFASTGVGPRRGRGPGALRQRSNVIATFPPLAVQLPLGKFVEGLFGLGSFFIGRFTLSRYF